MTFIESIKQFATGKTDVERKQSAATNLIIRRKARAAAFREKEKQEIRYATAKQKVTYDRKIKALNKPKQFMGPGSGLDYFRGQPRIQSKNVVKYLKIKKGKKKGTYRKVSTKQKTQPQTKQQPQQTKRFDVLGESSNGNGFRVI